jgi:capsular polysaccharide export protein
LEAKGCEVWRLCFEGGDVWETPSRNKIVVPSSVDFKAFVEAEMRRRSIDCVVTFNDILPRNRIVLELAGGGGIDLFVLENGYLRPHWVTLERDGVNGFSGMPRDRAFYLAHRAQRQGPGRSLLDGAVAPRAFTFRTRYHVLNTIGHFVAAVAGSPAFGFDASYYGDSVWAQAVGYMKEFGWRQLHDERTEVSRINAAKSNEGRPVFTALMQKPGDGQLLYHSPFQDRGNGGFLREVTASFARHAPMNAMLVVKQHPLDYGAEKSPEFAASLFREHGIENRAVYLRMTSMDICMDHSDGLVTVNSTGGLTALQKGLAVKCLGNAIYDVPGMTFQGALDAFWRHGRPAETDVLEGFIDYLVQSSQLNGGFHSSEARALLVPGVISRLMGDDGVAAGPVMHEVV